MNCKKCNSEKTYKNGKAMKSGKQKYHCNDCGYNFEDGSVLRESSKPKVGMSLDEFRDKHDVEYIIGKTLSQLSKDMIYQYQHLTDMKMVHLKMELQHSKREE